MDPRLIAPAALVVALLVLAGAVVLWSGSHLGATLATVGGIDPAAASAILAAQGRVNAALLGILALGLAAAVIGGYLIASTLGRELAEVGDTIESVAAKVSAGGGDFSTRIAPTGDPRKDRVVHGLNALLARLEAMVAQATRAGIKVTTSMTQISAGTKELEATMAEQVATTSEVTATAQIIAATATQLLSTMDEVVALSDGTVGNVATGRAALGDMQETMTRMRDASEKVSRRLNAINEHAAEIATVVTTITKVADQTNLLSLNAGIEAEKAGEYGHGFAVVAREIRRLADQTAVATLDIEKMVNQMKSAVGSGVMSTETLTQEVRETGSAVAHVGELLAKVIESVEALNPRFEGVHEGMRAQAHSAEKISRAMEQIGEATVQTAQSLRDTNQSLSELSEAAAVLQDEFVRRDPTSVGSRTAA